MWHTEAVYISKRMDIMFYNVIIFNKMWNKEISP